MDLRPPCHGGTHRQKGTAPQAHEHLSRWRLFPAKIGAGEQNEFNKFGQVRVGDRRRGWVTASFIGFHAFISRVEACLRLGILESGWHGWV